MDRIYVITLPAGSTILIVVRPNKALLKLLSGIYQQTERDYQERRICIHDYAPGCSITIWRCCIMRFDYTRRQF